MIKSGLRLFFGTFTQLIIVIVSYEFFFQYSANTGGIGGDVISNIHPLIWIIIAIELFMSFCLLALGIKNKSKLSNKL